MPASDSILHPEKFTAKLLAWFETCRRELPWRKDYAPYQVWVSEIMLQQTQMDRAVDYFNRFMERFPDPAALAEAHEDDVLKAWEGLGYYSRAKNLHKAANTIVRDMNGAFPEDPAAIRSLPGIGPYTAGAIGSIAFNHPVPAVDANVLRVFARLMNLSIQVKSKKAENIITQAVLELMPETAPRDFNQALMEFGALVCTPSNPECNACPVKIHCASSAAGTTPLRPVLPASKKKTRVTMATGVLARDGKIYIQKRSPHDVWPGLWEFPGGVVEKNETPRQALIREFKEETGLDIAPKHKITTVQYTYTRWLVTLHCWYCLDADTRRPTPELYEAVDGRFINPDALSTKAYPAGHRKLIEFMEKDLRLPPFLQSS